MARPTYPSDDKRKRQKPHIKVHLSIANHPKYASVFADPLLRGIVHGIWVVAARAHVSATQDQLSLTNADALWITGKERMVDAVKVLTRVCEVMNYEFRRSCDRHYDCRKTPGESPTNDRRVSRVPSTNDPRSVDDQPAISPRVICERPARWVIHVRNFSRKQGFTPHSATELRGATPPPISEEPKNQRSDYATRGIAEEREDWERVDQSHQGRALFWDIKLNGKQPDKPEPAKQPSDEEVLKAFKLEHGIPEPDEEEQT